MLTGEQQWQHNEWILRALIEKKRAQKNNPLLRLLNKERYSIDDYSVLKVKEDLWKSYNKITGEDLYYAQSETEAWKDLEEEFLQRA